MTQCKHRVSGANNDFDEDEYDQERDPGGEPAVTYSVAVSNSMFKETGWLPSASALASPSLHYRLRAIRDGPLGVVNFASHFKQKSYFHFLIH